jgi:hypothetical protein
MNLSCRPDDRWQSFHPSSINNDWARRVWFCLADTIVTAFALNGKGRKKRMLDLTQLDLRSATATRNFWSRDKWKSSHRSRCKLFLFHFVSWGHHLLLTVFQPRTCLEKVTVHGSLVIARQCKR